ncbi:hybrid sensor histidine kinase/response regulator [Aquabacterium lacunae]|uniref:histidine kinase n=1 Tax=Aquabacterium lacunae TaxID=2528630 RepID=A0A4Q9H5S4_9BURK|nr:hybrid sensor histidine kinase/response regulator [Aquabacterium lacunae]TBO32937.1 hybrid sensor histidine kinase/response regulator [Aquabacterium lacunae]
MRTVRQGACLFLLWALCGLLPVQAAQAGTQWLTQAWFAPGACSQAVVTTQVDLPDLWSTRGQHALARGCYRWQLELAQAPTQAWALRFDRLPSIHRIKVNGLVLLDHFRADGLNTTINPLPTLIDIPPSMLQAGINQIEIELLPAPFRQPGISAVQVGPMQAVRPGFERWRFWTVDVPHSVNLSVAGMAVFMLLAWQARKRDLVFAFIGGLMAVMGLRNAVYFVAETVWPDPIVDWLYFTAQVLTAWCLAGFGLSYARFDMRRVVWPMRALVLGLPLAGLASIGSGQMHNLRLVVYPLLILGSTAVVALVVRMALQRPKLEATAMIVGPVATLASAAHDYLMIAGLLAADELRWMPYTTPAIFVGYALVLLRKFVGDMAEAEDAKAQLEQRVAERTRALEIANQSKTRFLAAASHDLRQPTAAIGLLVTLLRQQNGLQGEARHHINMLDEAVASMESLLVGLLDISRLDAGAVKPQFQPVSVHELFQAVRVHEQSAAELKGLRLRFRQPARMGHVMVTTDAMLVHSVLRNLVSNAIRYTSRGGVLVAARRKGRRRLRIEVWDTGIGIPKDQLDRIFEEFYQVDNASRDRTRGIGLGLAIVQRTAGLLGEQVSVRSVPGKGSVFRFDLPLHQAPNPHQAPAAAPEQPLRGVTLWLVEDDALLRRALTELLQRWGAQVQAWGDAEALQGDISLMMSSPHLGPLPQVLISDYRLPGINGLQLCESVRAQLAMHGHLVNALIISGDTDPTEIGRLSQSGQAVLAKPFRSERLLERLLPLIHAAPAGRTNAH